MATKVKIRIQVGVEAWAGKTRIFRGTPYDDTFETDEKAASAIIMLASLADGADTQPGDGEIDVPLKNVTDALLSRLGALGKIDLPGDENAFVRIRRVA